MCTCMYFKMVSVKQHNLMYSIGHNLAGNNVFYGPHRSNSVQKIEEKDGDKVNFMKSYKLLYLLYI